VSSVAPALATVGHGGTAFWYLTRATGLVSLILLTATVVLGMVASVGWTSERWPRFVTQGVHRNLSLLCLVLIGVHVATTVADGYVPIGYLDAVVPFRTAYRPLWVGLGALGFDLLLAVAISSGLRRRIGARAWRSIHLLAYLCWPIALLHALGTGTDTRLTVAMGIEWACVAAVIVVGTWRLVAGSAVPAQRRVVVAVAGLVVVAGIAVFAVLGPLRPGWSHRSGTSSALLAQLSGAQAASGTAPTTPPATTLATTAATPTSGSGLPTAPFAGAVSGTYRSTPVPGGNQIQVVLDLTVAGTSTGPLVVRLDGTQVSGGVAMSSGAVSWGSARGTVTALAGSTIRAGVSGDGRSVALDLDLQLDQATGTVGGSASGSPSP